MGGVGGVGVGGVGSGKSGRSGEWIPTPHSSGGETIIVSFSLICGIVF